MLTKEFATFFNRGNHFEKYVNLAKFSLLTNFAKLIKAECKFKCQDNGYLFDFDAYYESIFKISDSEKV